MRSPEEAEALLSAPELSADGFTLTVAIPLAIRKRGGRKRLVTPDGEPAWAPRREVSSALVKALARGFRWKRLIEDGHYGSIVELAKGEKISQSYVRRLLRLTLLSPEIVEAILDGREAGLQLEDLREELPVEWEHQTIGQRAGPAMSRDRPKSAISCHVTPRAA